jgi:hypothetical protein
MILMTVSGLCKIFFVILLGAVTVQAAVEFLTPGKVITELNNFHSAWQSLPVKSFNS